MNEKEAMATTTPVMVLSLSHVAYLGDKSKPAQSTIKDRLPLSANDTTSKLSTRCCTEATWIRRLRIFRNYDGGGTPEVQVTSYRIDNSGQQHWTIRSSGHWELDQSDTWCDWTDPNRESRFADFSTANWHLSRYFFNVYERDWYGSNKPLGEATYKGTKIYFYGNRNFTDEWYYFNPFDSQGNPSQLDNVWVDLQTIYNNTGVLLTGGIMPSDSPEDPNIECASNPGGSKIEMRFSRGWF